MENKKFVKIKQDIKKMYLENNYNWLVGFSGGKDSTVMVQIIIESLLELDPKLLKNKIYITSSDTLIENPIVLKQLNTSLSLIKDFVQKNNLPIIIKKVSPKIDDTFWTNLIGRGYPLPNQTFRWCTDRLKIKPMNAYLEDIAKTSTVPFIKVLGVRRGESNSRDQILKSVDTNTSNLRDMKNSKHLTYAPIEDMNLKDVWEYLSVSPLDFFKKNNITLSILYEDSSTGTKECPSTLDDNLAKDCGGSRWGCWLCPVIQKDKSMEGFINSGQNWMQPLLDFRDIVVYGRDIISNRYYSSFRINAAVSKITTPPQAYTFKRKR